MGKVGKAKKKGVVGYGGDFAKQKLKVGRGPATKRAATAAARTTDTSFSVRKVRVPGQKPLLQYSRDGDEINDINIDEIIAKMRHFSGNHRRAAVSTAQAAVQTKDGSPWTRVSTVLVSQVSQLLVDEDNGVRRAAKSFLSGFLSCGNRGNGCIPLFLGTLIMRHVLTALSYPRAPVRKNALLILSEITASRKCDAAIQACAGDVLAGLSGALADRAQDDLLNLRLSERINQGGQRDCTKVTRDGFFTAVRRVLEMSASHPRDQIRTLPFVSTRISGNAGRDLIAVVCGTYQSNTSFDIAAAFLPKRLDQRESVMRPIDSGFLPDRLRVLVSKIGRALVECWIEIEVESNLSVASELASCINSLAQCFPSVEIQQLDAVLQAFPLASPNDARWLQVSIGVNLTLCSLGCRRMASSNRFDLDTGADFLVSNLDFRDPYSGLSSLDAFMLLYPRLSSAKQAEYLGRVSRFAYRMAQSSETAVILIEVAEAFINHVRNFDVTVSWLVAVSLLYDRLASESQSKLLDLLLHVVRSSANEVDMELIEKAARGLVLHSATISDPIIELLFYCPKIVKRDVLSALAKLICSEDETLSSGTAAVSLCAVLSWHLKTFDPFEIVAFIMTLLLNGDDYCFESFCPLVRQIRLRNQHSQVMQTLILGLQRTVAKSPLTHELSQRVLLLLKEAGCEEFSAPWISECLMCALAKAVESRRDDMAAIAVSYLNHCSDAQIADILLADRWQETDGEVFLYMISRTLLRQRFCQLMRVVGVIDAIQARSIATSEMIASLRSEARLLKI